MPDVLPLAALLRHHDQHFAVRLAQQLAVEQVRGDGVVEPHLRLRNLDADKRNIQAGRFFPQGLQQRLLLHKGLLMVEQHVAIAHRNHVVMEHAAVDGRRILLGKDGIFRVQPMQPRHRLARLQGLARRIFLRGHAAAGAPAVDKQLQPLTAVVVAEAVMVCRPFIAQIAVLSEGMVMDEIIFVGKGRAQNRRGGGRFLGAVQLIGQVGDRKVQPAVGAVGGR